MKKTISRILTLVLAGTMLLALSACGEKLPEEKTVWLEYSRLDLSTNGKSTYEYDEYGNQIKASQSDAAGNVTSVRLYEYDENSNLIRTTLNKSDGTSFVQLEQLFDETETAPSAVNTQQTASTSTLINTMSRTV